MNIKIWSDFLCPYCVLGKMRLQNALLAAGVTDANIEMKSFLLNPGEDNPEGMRMHEHLMSKYQYSEEEVGESFNNLTAAGAELGFAFDFASAIHAGTDRAHALFQHMKAKGLGTAFSDLLQKAGFQQGADLHDEETLLRLATSLGVDKEEAKKAMYNQDNQQKAQAEYEEALVYGARGVPFFVIDERFAISGAQSEEVFEKTIKRAQNK